MTAIREAARARGGRERYRYPADRPQQRRSDEGERHGPVLVRGRLSSMHIRGVGVDEGPLTFEGMASVTGQPYEMWDWYGPYIEVVEVGAFTETLAREDLDVPLVISHDSMRRIARTTSEASPLELDEITEGEETGLHVLASNLDRTDPDVLYAISKLSSGLVDEMSFRFEIQLGSWSPDWTEYHIDRVNIHRGDVSIVGYGANPYTSGGLRDAPSPRLASRGTPAALTRLRLALADDDVGDVA